MELSACPILIKPIVNDFIVRKCLGKKIFKKIPMILGGHHGKKLKTEMGVLENAMRTHVGIKFFKTFNLHRGKNMRSKVFSNYITTFHAFTIIL